MSSTEKRRGILLRKSEYEISMKPSYGAFINFQEILKEVLQVVKKDKTFMRS